MVCAKCEKKLSKVATTYEKRDKGAATGAGTSGYGAGGKANKGKLGGENKLLSSKNKWKPYGVDNKCTVCKMPVHQEGKYCHNCAYKKGLCAMCGKQVLDTEMYKMSGK